MYRKVEDFIADWNASAEGTIRVLESLTDEKLDQAIVEGHSTLGWLGWHLASAPAFFGGLVGLNVKVSGNPSEVPTKAATIVQAYKKIAEDVKTEAELLTDEQLTEEVDSFGAPTPRGAILRQFIDHQIHHRGQMTVLLRQAGLKVPGVMGPTKEESN
ncbi:DinB family protein [Gracilibacillus sp. S3-1-1]|uniref:DinB family protein n=1 Tax=Gracilibacillus pellucidus TaxID=3095368 RepID=A0ACC6M2X9_9BACI|nr:DinB family protein [Gracilibacillus sp. S3-1-1]MDX8045241.1 DinB family protein [Gracilibacillus sp. S3-1-1]